jgi:hypothetical protein
LPCAAASAGVGFIVPRCRDGGPGGAFGDAGQSVGVMQVGERPDSETQKAASNRFPKVSRTLVV